MDKHTQSLEHPTQKETAADAVAEQLDADVILYNGWISRPYDTLLIEECISRFRRKNVLLLLITEGGHADPAYRIARCLQTKYDRFYLYVSGYCKSAGTLVAAGAHELIISDHGELGPLDVQMSKKDELWEKQSGLTVMDTLTSLQQNAFLAFEKFFLNIKRRSEDTITLKTATEIATNMTTGLFTPLYSQIDPMHVGEATRAMSIATQYCKRLLDKSGNITLEALKHITTMYPSHGFVIDREEAKVLFKCVRKPTQPEMLLVDEIGEEAILPSEKGMTGNIPPFTFLSSELDVTPKSETKDPKGESNESGPRIPARVGSRGINRTSRKKLRHSDDQRIIAKPATVRKDRNGGSQSV